MNSAHGNKRMTLARGLGPENHAHTIKVNYNSVCDLERFEKFNDFVTQISTCKRISKFTHLFLELIRNVVHCHISSCFLFQNNMLE